MTSANTPQPSSNPVTFLLHIPAPPSLHADAEHTVDHVLLSVDSPRAQLTMHLPVGLSRRPLSRATWERWIAFLLTSFTKKFNTSVFERNILLNLTCLYRAFTIGPRRLRVNSDFYVSVTHGFIELARGAMGRCVKQDLALYLADMSVLVPYSTREEVLSIFHACHDSDSQPITSDFSNEEAVPDITMSAPLSPSISTASELTDANAHDSGYESFDSMPSLRTVEDSSDDYFSNSSEEPDSDEEEEALIRRGFVVHEDDADMSDLDL